MDISFTTNIRVRYADTDQMGIVYYAKYLEYFEVARTELLRSLGLPYSEVEEKGFALPVSQASIKYYKGAVYDDELSLTATLDAKHSPKVEIHYEVKRNTELIAEGDTTLVFVDKKTGKPTRAPQFYLEAIEKNNMSF